ncbi:MAG: hypothetical protein ABII72_03860 [Parcubacteria group bacterium]
MPRYPDELTDEEAREEAEELEERLEELDRITAPWFGKQLIEVAEEDQEVGEN